jgi:hypothetical protein
MDQLDALLGHARSVLRRWPLYISLDKDVMTRRDAIVNWDSGYLALAEVQAILRWFIGTAGGQLAGMDVMGDWSAVRVRGLLRRALHWAEHPRLAVDPDEARRRNGEVNTAVLECVRCALAESGVFNAA